LLQDESSKSLLHNGFNRTVEIATAPALQLPPSHSFAMDHRSLDGNGDIATRSVLAWLEKHWVALLAVTWLHSSPTF